MEPTEQDRKKGKFKVHFGM